MLEGAQACAAREKVRREEADAKAKAAGEKARVARAAADAGARAFYADKLAEQEATFARLFAENFALREKANALAGKQREARQELAAAKRRTMEIEAAARVAAKALESEAAEQAADAARLERELAGADKKLAAQQGRIDTLFRLTRPTAAAEIRDLERKLDSARRALDEVDRAQPDRAILSSRNGVFWVRARFAPASRIAAPTLTRAAWRVRARRNKPSRSCSTARTSSRSSRTCRACRRRAKAVRDARLPAHLPR